MAEKIVFDDSIIPIEEVTTCDMHTAGEPVRIIEAVKPDPSHYLNQFTTLLDKIDFLRNRLDHLRQIIMHEPRGHHDMYGAFLQQPDNIEEADIAVIFMHNQGYSTMCGHATIALGRYFFRKWNLGLKNNTISSKEPIESQIRLQCPCGVVHLFVNHKDESVRFESVPAFASGLNMEILLKNDVDDCSKNIHFDIGYGGAFYAIVHDKELGLNLDQDTIEKVVNLATYLKAAINADEEIIRSGIVHPTGPVEYNFLYGIIVTDGADSVDSPMTKNVCVFADREVDRSPTGSGVTARVAVQFAKQQIIINQTKRFQNSALGEASEFLGKPIREIIIKPTTSASFSGQAIIVEVSGKGYFTGEHKFKIELDDPFRNGFKLL